MTKYRVVSYVDQEGYIFYELQRQVWYIWTTVNYGYYTPEKAISIANEYIETEQRKRNNKKKEGKIVWSN